MAPERPAFLPQNNSSSTLPPAVHLHPMPALPKPSSSSPASPAASPSPFTAISDSASLPSVSSPPFQLPSSGSLDSHPRANGADSDAHPSTQPNQPPDVDPQILEALRSKDRIYVLKLGELMEGLINDRRPRIDLTPSTSYQRLLVHRCSAYYKLAPESDPISKGIAVLPTPESRIPARRICELVPAEATTQPAFKIMRRSPSDRRSNKAQSQTGSVAGDDADLSDVEPSETGSLGGRSNATGGSGKKRMTIEEREAAYNEARSRIFMDFEEKEKEKEKDMSASSSSLSLVSGSASTSAGGGSSVSGDLDDAASSPATESEYSGPGPSGRDKKDSRHLARNASASSSSRSLRSSAPSFTGGQSSARNSRAPSPSFTYATIYEPSQGTVYDPSQPPPHHGYHPSQYLYPYSPPGQPPNPYFGGYPYYPPYNPYQPPPPHVQHSVSDPATPSSSELYMSHPHSGYSHPYGWPPPPQHSMQSPPHMQHPSQLPPPPPPPHHALNPGGAPPPPVSNPQYQPYMPPPHAYTYPMYYPPPLGHSVESPPLHASQNMYDASRSLNGNAMGNLTNNNGASSIGRNGITSPANTNGRPPNRHSGVNGGKGRGAPMNSGRAAWSSGPGVSQGGHVTSPASVGLDAVGPRLSSSRRTSNNSSNSRSSNCDDVSSTASSSTTSSSSRRTYTSTTSSQHPLPPRPDWAVGLKPQPTLHTTQSRHHDRSHDNSRTMSPASGPRNLNGNTSHPSNTTLSQQKFPVPLQSSTEFPPLSSGNTAPEKRTPVVSGAWGNNSSARNIRMPSPGQGLGPGQANAGALVHHPNNSCANDNPETRLEDSDRGFERPPPKSAELYNPKVLRRSAGGKAPAEKEKERVRGDVIGVVLAAQVDAMSVEGKSTDSQPAASEKEPSSVAV
ncbi:putative SUZ domain containing protein [Lyophyllum shimeji]|uniref:SUZ domain containing protein n=1 Tax=Lyophyllum shimeji TaxID=47721 RepID=A0A9P3UNP1_LYOSH|nr:putative SUZ domain containing protein [Lyophyllum shimeji]